MGGAIAGLNAVRTPFLAHASEVVLPFYILHQTVILTIGWVVVRWAIPDLARWAVIAVVSLAATVAGCELVRRVSVLRVLFGMNARRGQPGTRLLVSVGPRLFPGALRRSWQGNAQPTMKPTVGRERQSCVTRSKLRS